MIWNAITDDVGAERRNKPRPLAATGCATDPRCARRCTPLAVNTGQYLQITNIHKHRASDNIEYIEIHRTVGQARVMPMLCAKIILAQKLEEMSTYGIL